jgi:uncharacterized protein YndB with AHSA1/START domain
MSDRTVSHDTFVIERHFAAAPARVFSAWADVELKSRWFGGGAGWNLEAREFDFRPGGHELLRGRWQSGMVTEFRARFADIVPDRRIVYTYEMRLDGKRISISLATVEIEPDGSGTRMSVTEQGAFLDGYDDAGSRQRGTASLMDRFAASLEPPGG